MNGDKRNQPTRRRCNDVAVAVSCAALALMVGWGSVTMFAFIDPPLRERHCIGPGDHGAWRLTGCWPWLGPRQSFSGCPVGNLQQQECPRRWLMQASGDNTAGGWHGLIGRCQPMRRCRSWGK